MSQRLVAVSDELRFLFITSQLNLKPVTEVPGESVMDHGIGVLAKASNHRKCVRCWHYRADVGANSDDPELCGRCVENVYGAGETRKYF